MPYHPAHTGTLTFDLLQRVPAAIEQIARAQADEQFSDQDVAAMFEHVVAKRYGADVAAPLVEAFAVLYAAIAAAKDTIAS